MKNVFPNRHIHLDFHTSPLIPDIGADFDPEEFVSTLAKAGVNSICCFAKCHHGMSYYPTKVGTVHPNLSRDLFGEQIETCHRHGINCTVYTTVDWDEDAAFRHPEWRQVDRSGRPIGHGPLDLSERWQWLCMNTTYADYVIEQAEEVARLYSIDGFFVDITFQSTPGCFCNKCVSDMRAEEVNLDSDEEVRAFSLGVDRKFMARFTNAVRAIRPDLPVFYNSRLRLTSVTEEGCAPELAYQSHVEIESLPSGGWGYNHFPLYVRYFQTLGIPHLGHTGRFHKSWADFGGLKPRAALEYECFRMLSSGSGLCVGDQLHPRGRLDKGVYQRIGEVYNEIAKVEPWCEDSEPLADIGVLLATRVPPDQRNADYSIEEGAMRALLELHQQFQFVDSNADFSRYRLLIVPDAVRTDSILRSKIDSFVAGGGSLLVTGSSGFSAETPDWPTLGVIWERSSEFCPEFLHLGAELAPIAPPLDYVVYERGERVGAAPGTDVLAVVGEPYFNRTPAHYTSHQHSPIARVTDVPAITRKGRAIYCAFPLFRAYKLHGNQIYKQVLQKLIELLLPDPLLKIEAPSTAEATILRQKISDESRLVVHLLHYIPQRRTPNLDLVEDVIPLFDVPISVKTDSPPTSVYLAPERIDLKWEWQSGYVRFVVPTVNGHQLVCITD